MYQKVKKKNKQKYIFESCFKSRASNIWTILHTVEGWMTVNSTMSQEIIKKNLADMFLVYNSSTVEILIYKRNKYLIFKHKFFSNCC
jgi:hypothetical protein